MIVSWEPLVLMTAADGTCDRERCNRVAKWQVENTRTDRMEWAQALGEHVPESDLRLACTIHLAAICTELVTLDG